MARPNIELKTIKFNSPIRSDRYQTTHKTWLYSRSNQKEIAPHRFDRKKNEDVWFLTPGLYFTLNLYRSNWRIQVLRVNDNMTYGLEEPHYIPEWLTPILPNTAQIYFNRKAT